jgi:hypothetical protein
VFVFVFVFVLLLLVVVAVWWWQKQVLWWHFENGTFALPMQYILVIDIAVHGRVAAGW